MKQMDVAHANKLYDEKDHSAFMDYCLSFQQVENGNVLDSMGLCYRDGKGVEQDLAKAIACFEQAVEQGYLYAAIRLGVIYRRNETWQDLDKAIFWYRFAADRGVSDAMYNLGNLYRWEESVRNMAESIRWYEKAAEAGDADAMYQLGFVYRKETERKDPEKSFAWFKKAAEAGNSDAMYQVGWLYKYEKEPVDLEMTRFWYGKAAACGDVDAMVGMGNLHRDANGADDPEKALDWYRKAACRGSATGKYQLAKLVLKYPELANEEEAFKALMESARMDQKDALILLEEHARKENGIAQFYLGRYYAAQLEGNGLAMEWYGKAALQGYVPAQNMILMSRMETASVTVQEIKRETTVIAQTTADNSRKLDAISAHLLAMNDQLAEIRRQIFTGQPESQEDEEHQVLQQAAEVINRTVNRDQAERLEQQEEALKHLFGEKAWSALLPESQISLLSSAMLLRACEGMPSQFDYSGICITAIVALEQELKRVFSDGYLRYLQETRDPEEWPAALTKGRYYFSLGKLLTFFGFSKKDMSVSETIYTETLREYLSTVVKEEYRADPIAAFVKPNDPNSMVARCVRINGEYRRQAAHSGNISFDDAVDCCFEIYGEASAHMEAKRHSAEVISILRELFSILA